MVTMCSQSSSGMRLRSTDPERPCVPVLAPRGAAVWHGSPFLHIGLKRGSGWLVQMSVGFMRSSPYWQYVTV